MEQLKEYPSMYREFRTFVGDGLYAKCDDCSTSDRYFGSLIEQWLECKGFTFRIELDGSINKVRYVVYYRGNYFDAGEDELKSLELLKDTYITCVKKIYKDSKKNVNLQVLQVV